MYPVTPRIFRTALMRLGVSQGCHRGVGSYTCVYECHECSPTHVTRTLIRIRCNRPAMQNVTVRLGEDLLAELDEEAEQKDVSRSEHIRNILATRNKDTVTPAEYDALQDECKQLRDERDRLQTELDHCQARLDQSLERIEQRMPEKQKVTAIKRYQERGFVGRLRDRLFGGKK